MDNYEVKYIGNYLYNVKIKNISEHVTIEHMKQFVSWYGTAWIEGEKKGNDINFIFESKYEEYYHKY
jgi:hypothetical protein